MEKLEMMATSLWVKYKTSYLRVEINQNKHVLDLDVIHLPQLSNMHVTALHSIYYTLPHNKSVLGFYKRRM